MIKIHSVFLIQGPSFPYTSFSSFPSLLPLPVSTSKSTISPTFPTILSFSFLPTPSSSSTPPFSSSPTLPPAFSHLPLFFSDPSPLSLTFLSTFLTLLPISFFSTPLLSFFFLPLPLFASFLVLVVVFFSFISLILIFFSPTLPIGVSSFRRTPVSTSALPFS